MLCLDVDFKLASDVDYRLHYFLFEVLDIVEAQNAIVLSEDQTVRTDYQSVKLPTLR